MPDQDTATLLAHAREAAGMTQKELAQRLSVNQSQISRIENGDVNTEPKTLDGYLRAIGSEEALRLADILNRSWVNLPPPSPNHPDIFTLMAIEEALERLSTFMDDDPMPHALAGQSELLFKRLTEFADFLLRLDHRIVYIGEIGVGKTTAACLQAGLVIDPSTAPDLRGMILDTGGGRVTLCDVHVQRGSGYAIQVDPLPDEEMYRLVEELCHAVKKPDNTAPIDSEQSSRSASDFRPPEEVERALRNMAGLMRPTRRKGQPPQQDPIATIADAAPTLDDLKADVAARLALWRRTRRTIEFDGVDQRKGKEWLKATFTAINNGRHPDFSLPARINITVPFSLASHTPYEISLADTRGIDGTGVRADLAAHLRDHRAVSVMCSRWGSAPDPSTQEALKNIAETEARAALTARVSILVLARAGEALSMRHESGEGVDEPDEGYGIKCDHVHDALERANLSAVDVTVFDATNDDPSELSAFLMSKVDALRDARRAGARATIAAVDHLLENVKEAEALAAVETVNNQLRIFADRHSELAQLPKPAQARLLLAVRRAHARTVWASTRRAGSFWNFDAYQHIGDGASADAMRRAAPALHGIREIVQNNLNDANLRSAHAFLDELLLGIGDWESHFLEAARHHAIAIIKPPLSSANDVWWECERPYGLGEGAYREHVATELDHWFDRSGTFQEQLERLLQQAWQRNVVGPLRAATGQPTRNGEHTAS